MSGNVPSEIIITKSGTSTGLGVVIIMGIILLAVYFWISLSLTDSINLTESQNNASNNLICPKGQCAMDMSTGEKICTSGNQLGVPYNPLTQVCMNPTVCSGQYPYAVNSDGSTNTLGQCPIDPVTGERTNCRCFLNSSCASYITTVWNSISGNPYTALSDSRTQFSQALGYNLGGDVGINSDGNLSFPDPNVTFCQVPMTWVLRSSPGCSGISGSNASDLAVKCVQSNPCLQGTLAYISGDSSSFDTNSLYENPLACVSEDNTCNDNDIPVYDTSYGKIVCIRDL